MKKGYTHRICFFCLILALFLLLNGCAVENGQNTEPPATTEPDISTYLARIAELEAELAAMREQQYIDDIKKQNENKEDPPGKSDNGVEKSIFHYRVENGNAFVTGYEGNASIVSLPATLDGYPVRGIDDRAFEGAGFTALTLPEGILSVGWFAFYDCRQLVELSLPASITTIGYGAFDGCERIRVVCPAGSYAEQCVKSYGLSYTNG